MIGHSTRSASIFLVGTHFLAYVGFAIVLLQSCEKLDLMLDGGTGDHPIGTLYIAFAETMSRRLPYFLHPS